MKLSREIRAFLGDPPASRDRLNTWAGSPGPAAMMPFVTLRGIVEGPVDAHTGFLVNIKAIDDLFFSVAMPSVRRRAREGGASATPASILQDLYAITRGRIGPPLRLCGLELSLSPLTRWAISAREPDMVYVTQSFEFSASHRLHCASFSEAQNRQLFGKCANPHGHGHNYVLEVTVAGAVDERTGAVANLEDLNALVQERVIEPFDHKHLNLDCPDFAQLNPTVENIARVIWQRLAGALPEGRLASVKVWETPKTWAEYCGDDGGLREP